MPSLSTGGKSAAAWQAGNTLYVLVVEGDAGMYSSYLDQSARAADVGPFRQKDLLVPRPANLLFPNDLVAAKEPNEERARLGELIPSQVQRQRLLIDRPGIQLQVGRRRIGIPGFPCRLPGRACGSTCARRAAASAAIVAAYHVFRIDLDVNALFAQRIAAADHLVDDLVFREAMGPAALARMVEAGIQGLANRAFQMLREVNRSDRGPFRFGTGHEPHFDRGIRIQRPAKVNGQRFQPARLGE